MRRHNDVADYASLLQTLAGGLLLFLGGVVGQRMTTERERERRRLDEEVRYKRSHDRLQANTLEAAQQLAARTIERTVDRLRLLQRAATSKEVNPAEEKQIDKAFKDAWNSRNRLALIRERITDDTLREKLQALNSSVAKHIGAWDDHIDFGQATKEMSDRFDDANNHLGELLRKLI
jgi:hypothetical protein